VLEFFLFLVVFPVKYISSVSPRFYFRKHTFCFLPLVAILESSDSQILMTKKVINATKEKKYYCQAWWLTLVILASQEAEIRRITIGDQPRQNVC
jgi:hypothetical protein